MLFSRTSAIRRWLHRRRCKEQDRQRSSQWAGQHWIFDAFPIGKPRPEVAGMLVDCIGSHVVTSFMPGNPPARVDVGIPELTEEYFEWIDVFTAAYEARGRFVMLEMGAGFGRWGAIGALAARTRGITDIQLGFAEAEPQHALWLKQHMANNDIAPDEYDLHEVAVSGASGSAQFLVSLPESWQGNNPRDWYGQSLASSAGLAAEGGQVTESYFGKPLKLLPNGWGAIDVPLVPFADLLKPYDYVDIADLDIQGAEADAIECAVGELNARVRRMHIATHSEVVEQRLRTTLNAAKWICLRDWPCGKTCKTEFGSVAFTDGVQTWVNPRMGR